MDKSKKIIRKNKLVKDLSDKLIREMFVLFEKYYDHVDYERFASDLKEKTHVFFFYEVKTNRLVGFSTIFRKTIPEIAPGTFLFSGDTVIHEDYWGSKALQKSFFWFILESKLLSPGRPVYWMLMSKGVKTYLMMRKNFEASYPNYQGKTPPPFDHILNEFYSMKFPGDFKKESGLILFKEKMGSVKSTLKPPPEKAVNNLDADYFFRINPQYSQGDELACVCEIQFSDFAFLTFKFFVPGFKRK